MDYTRIYALLDKYWACITSVEEERELREFFESQIVPPDLQPYKAWFSCPEAEDLQQLGKDFDRQVMESIFNERKRLNKQYMRYTIGLILVVTGILGLIFFLFFPVFSI